MIIVPDVHGRTFWKDVYNYPKETIVFLGDYLDPYLFEFFTDEERNTLSDNEINEKVSNIRYDAIQNFKEIIEFKKSNPDRVILLLGNHDCGYAINDNICSCRHDWENDDEIAMLFKQNWDLFDLAYKTVYRGETIVFSHAGIREDWFRMYQTYPKYDGKGFGQDHIVSWYDKYPYDCLPTYSDFRKNIIANISNDGVVDFINKMYHEKNEMFFSMLAMIPRSRGGRDHWGSMIWEDFDYWNYWSWRCFQPVFGTMIFGHSYRLTEPSIYAYIACIDDRNIHFLKDIMKEMYIERNDVKHDYEEIEIDENINFKEPAYKDRIKKI